MSRGSAVAKAAPFPTPLPSCPPPALCLPENPKAGFWVAAHAIAQAP